jgi:hypothetical protein
LILCPTCSRPNKDFSLFCVGCGNRLTKTGSAAPGAQPSGSSSGDSRSAMRETRFMANPMRDTRIMSVPPKSVRDSGESRNPRDTVTKMNPSVKRPPSPDVEDHAQESIGSVPERVIAMLCKECQQVTRSLSPFCQHCGRPLTNLQGSVQLQVRWSGGKQSRGEPAVYALVSARPSIRFLSGAPQRNLGFLIDGAVLWGAGSRRDTERSQLVRRFLDHVVDEMSPQDHLTIGFYGLRTYLLVAGERIEDKRAAKRLIERKLEGLEVGEGSVLCEGIEQTWKEVKRNLSQDRVNRIIVLTDSPVSDPDEALRACSYAKEHGVSFSTLTLEHGDNEFMQQLARAGDGKCYPNVEFRHIPEILSQELMTVRATFTTNAEMYAHAAPGWEVSRVFKTNPVVTDLTESLSNPSRACLKLADLQLYDEQSLLFELVPVAASPDRTVIARVEVICDFPHDDVTNMTFSVPVTVGRPHEAFATQDRDVLKMVNLLTAVFGA